MSTESDIGGVSGTATQARRHQGHRARRSSARTRWRRNSLIGGLVVAALAVTLALPPVQTVLRQSFTRLPSPYTALYFTSDPTVDGVALSVPITLEPVDAGSTSYGVRVWTVSASGAVNADTRSKITADKKGVWSTVVRLTIAPTAAVVWVSLDGTAQTLHYRINGT
jgi:hypothetical protein